jgi:hypothetical protein
MAWEWVRANRGFRSAGVDGETAYYIEEVLGVEQLVNGLRVELRGQLLAERGRAARDPKRGGKVRPRPLRSLLADLRLPRRLHLATGSALATREVPKRTWRWLIGRHLPRWRPTDGEVTLFNPAKVATTRYGYRGAKIATPWQTGRIARRDPVCGPERLEN